MTVKTIATDAEFAAFESANADRPVLLSFTASWCMPCKAMAPVIEDIADLYEERFETCRIDIETCPETAARFAVRGVPTLLLRNAQQEMFAHLGPLSKSRLAVAIEDGLAGAGQ